MTDIPRSSAISQAHRNALYKAIKRAKNNSRMDLRGSVSKEDSHMIDMAGKAIRKWWALFALPTFAAFIIGFLIPFIMGVYLSFCEFTTVTDGEPVGLKNYQKALADPQFLHALGFSTAFTIVTTIVINVIAFAIAYVLTRAIRGSSLYRSALFMPNLIGGIVLGYIWLLLLNGILAHWGRALTYSATYGFWGLVIVVCWQQIGYMMIIYIAGLQSLPSDVLEAAAVDGANGRQIMFKIIVPLMMPSITVCSFLTVTNGFKLYDQNLALTNGAPSYMSEGLAMNITRTFYGRMGWEGVGQAKAVLFFILVAAIALIQNKLTTSKEVQA